MSRLQSIDLSVSLCLSICLSVCLSVSVDLFGSIYPFVKMCFGSVCSSIISAQLVLISFLHVASSKSLKAIYATYKH